MVRKARNIRRYDEEKLLQHQNDDGDNSSYTFTHYSFEQNHIGNEGLKSICVLTYDSHHFILPKKMLTPSSPASIYKHKEAYT